MKQLLNRFMAFCMALLVLWAGNGYGVLEHSCEEHGKHQHILSNWVQTSCEHEHHHESESDEHEHVDSGFEASHSEDQVNFVYLEAETLFKTSVACPEFTPLFQTVLTDSLCFSTPCIFFRNSFFVFSHSPFSTNIRAFAFGFRTVFPDLEWAEIR